MMAVASVLGRRTEYGMGTRELQKPWKCRWPGDLVDRSCYQGKGWTHYRPYKEGLRMAWRKRGGGSPDGHLRCLPH